MDRDGTVADRLAREVTQRLGSPLPPEVRREAQRTLLNVLATTIGASGHPAVTKVIRLADQIGSQPTTHVPGRGELLDPYHAALAIGVAGHVDDFDDTHLATVIHPGAATLAAALAAASTTDTVTGEQFLAAIAFGCEVQLRVGVAMSPSHYDAGWHITGTCGVIGAAVATGIILGLSEEELADAICLAASQPLGLRQAFGTMTKAFHVGKAAANGLLCAKLAREGHSDPTSIIEEDGGFFPALAADWTTELVTEGWGERWEILSNTYKPYPCGIVIHPVIDAAIELHAQTGGRLDDITGVTIHCHPLVKDLTGNPDPQDGLEARFSAIHGAAIGLAHGRGGLHEFDHGVRSPDLVTLRAKTQLATNEGIRRDEATVEVHFNDSTVQSHVMHARGSERRPLSDQELLEKAAALIEPVLGDVASSIRDAIDLLPDASSIDDLLASFSPNTLTESR